MIYSTKRTFIKRPAFILHCILFILGIIGLILSILTMGVTLFSYYTQLSNIFCMITSLLFIIESIKAEIRLREFEALRNVTAAGAVELPHWLTVLRYMATSMVTVTFLIAVTVLAPMFDNILQGYLQMLFAGANFFYHVACPILSIIIFGFFEKSERLSFTATFQAIIPTILYAAVTIVLNILHVLYGPYPFLHVYEQSPTASALWCLSIIFVAWILAILNRFIHNRGISNRF